MRTVVAQHRQRDGPCGRHCARLLTAREALGAAVTSELLLGGSGREMTASTRGVPLKQVRGFNSRSIHSQLRNARVGAARGHLLGPSGIAGQILIFGEARGQGAGSARPAAHFLS